MIFCHTLENQSSKCYYVKIGNHAKVSYNISIYTWLLIGNFFNKPNSSKNITILCWLNNITNDFWKLVQSCRDFLLLLQLLFDYNCVNKFVFCPKAILNLISYKLDWWDFTGKRSPYLPFNAHICKNVYVNFNNIVRS